MNIFDYTALYVFILSMVFSLKYGLEFILNMKSEDPEPLVIDKTNKILLLISVSYVITYIITLFIN